MSSFTDNNEVPELDTWGTKGYLLMEQAEALVEFMSVAKESDLCLAKFNVESLESVSLRFLRARQFSVPDALQLLRQCLEKKSAGRAKHFAEQSAPDVLKCDIEALKKFYPHAQLGYDKLNRPIFYEQSGQINPAAITSMTTYGSLINYHFLTMEKELNDMFEQAETRGKGPVVFSTCAVLDLEGLSMVHCTGSALEHMKSLIALDNICYPETLGKMFVVNSPWLAVTTWEIVKGWLEPRTQAKIEILGSGPEVSAKLLRYIDADVLPARYGGTGPDWAPARPHAEHVQISRSSDARREVSVPAGHTLYVESYVPEGEIVVEIYVSPIQFDDGSENISGKSDKSSSSCSPKSSSKNINFDKLIQLNKVALKPEGQSGPVRDRQEFPNPTDTPMYFVLRWCNPAMLVGRSMVTNVYSEPDPTLLH